MERGISENVDVLCQCCELGSVLLLHLREHAHLLWGKYLTEAFCCLDTWMLRDYFTFPIQFDSRWCCVAKCNCFSVLLKQAVFCAKKALLRAMVFWRLLGILISASCCSYRKKYKHLPACGLIETTVHPWRKAAVAVRNVIYFASAVLHSLFSLPCVCSVTQAVGSLYHLSVDRLLSVVAQVLCPGPGTQMLLCYNFFSLLWELCP